MAGAARLLHPVSGRATGRFGVPDDLRRRQVLDLAIDYRVTVVVSLLELLELLSGRYWTPAAVRGAPNSHSHAASL
jgi:hypothetical protein